MDDFFPDFDGPEDEDDEESGYFDDDGNKLNPELIPKPGLCLLCANEDNPHKLVECNLTRLDQDEDEGEFTCDEFKPKL